MWCDTSIAEQRPTPRGEAAMVCAGRRGFLSGSAEHDPGRWRS